MNLSYMLDMRSDSSYRPDTFPINSNIVDNRIQLGANPVVITLRKDYCSTMVALLECSQDLGSIISLVPKRSDRAGLAIVEWANGERAKWIRNYRGSKHRNYGLR